MLVSYDPRATTTPAAPLRPTGGLGVVPLVYLGVTAAIAGVQMAIQFWRSRKGPMQKLQATQYVDAAEPLLQENLRLFLSHPSLETQRATLENFDQAWDELKVLCGDPALGDPGRRCLSERQRGGVWDWFAAYRDPIASFQVPAPAAAPVVTTPLTASPAMTSAAAAPVDFGGVSDSPLAPWMMGAGLLAVGAAALLWGSGK